jgi:hypothetical protein
VNGINGAQGPAGANGLPGAVGPQGPTGTAGANGKDGVNGAQGPQGPAGANGLNGTNGAQGPAGPQGPKGDTGPAGPSGSSGIAGIGNIASILNAAYSIWTYGEKRDEKNAEVEARKQAAEASAKKSACALAEQGGASAALVIPVDSSGNPQPQNARWKTPEEQRREAAAEAEVMGILTEMGIITIYQITGRTDGQWDIHKNYKPEGAPHNFPLGERGNKIRSDYLDSHAVTFPTK